MRRSGSSNLSRAYRVNLTVLALVALFTGAFLVFSVLALSVAKRAQQFALLGVLGLTPKQRLRLVLAESLVLGTIGSVAGIALGTHWLPSRCRCWAATSAAATSPESCAVAAMEQHGGAGLWRTRRARGDGGWLVSGAGRAGVAGGADAQGPGRRAGPGRGVNGSRVA